MYEAKTIKEYPAILVNIIGKLDLVVCFNVIIMSRERGIQEAANILFDILRYKLGPPICVGGLVLLGICFYLTIGSDVVVEGSWL